MECNICFICYDSQVRIPRILGCGHTFCNICLNDIQKRSQEYKCPTCTTIHSYPSLESIPKNYTVLDIIHNQQEINKKLKCSDHPDEIKKYFDENCQKLICSSCVVLGQHSGHKCISIEDAITKYETNFQQSSNQITPYLQNIQEAENDTNHMIDLLNQQYENETLQINTTFQELILRLQKQQEDLHNELNHQYTTFSDSLKNHNGHLHSLKDKFDKCKSDYDRTRNKPRTIQYLEELITLNETYKNTETIYRESFKPINTENKTTQSLKYSRQPLLKFTSSGFENNMPRFGSIVGNNNNNNDNNNNVDDNNSKIQSITTLSTSLSTPTKSTSSSSPCNVDIVSLKITPAPAPILRPSKQLGCIDISAKKLLPNADVVVYDGNVYDVALAHVDISAMKDKTYIIQLLVSSTRGQPDQYYVFSRSDKLNINEPDQLHGAYSTLDEAIHVFEEKFEEKTQNSWARRQTFMKKKGHYELLRIDHANKANRRLATTPVAKWEYYVNDHVDGKATGWYEYTNTSTSETEELWVTFQSNPHLSQRIVESGKYSYLIDFSKMTQTNITHFSRTTRDIRRNCNGVIS